MYTSALYKFHLSTLNLEIKDICITIHRLSKEIQFNERKIKQILFQDIYKQFSFFECKKIDRTFLSHKSSCKSKFQRLIELDSTFSKTDNVDPRDNLTDSWFINLSDTQIPTTVSEIGKNFGISFFLSKLPTKHLIADFESHIHKKSKNMTETKQD